MVYTVFYYALLTWFVILSSYRAIVYSIYFVNLLKENKKSREFISGSSMKLSASGIIVMYGFLYTFLTLGIIYLPLVVKIISLVIIDLWMVCVAIDTSKEKEIKAEVRKIFIG